MKYRHFFWDFDGTLYDTYGRVTRANEKAMADLGVTLEYDALYRAVKRSIFYAWELYAVPRGIDWDTYFAAYRRHADEEGPESMMPYPGTGEALAKIVALGERISVTPIGITPPGTLCVGGAGRLVRRRRHQPESFSLQARARRAELSGAEERAEPGGMPDDRRPGY